MQKYCHYILSIELATLKLFCILFSTVMVLQAEQALPDKQDSKENPAQFFYTYKTEIAYNNQPGFMLDPVTDQLACKLNKGLGQSILFDTTFIRKPKEVRQYFNNAKPSSGLIGKQYQILTDDGVVLNATHFDRNSDTLLIIGAGFTNPREVMSPYIAMFPDYDIVIFDFRGHGYKTPAFSDPDTWPCSLTKIAFGIDANVVRFGAEEDKDIYAVVDGFKLLNQYKKNKEYKKVFGLGVCYGAFILAKTVAMHPGLFDKIVLDGCWLSLPQYIEKIKGDFKIMCNPQAGGWKDHIFFGNETVKDFLEFIARNFFLELSDISLTSLAPKINQTPVLFFYGKNDYTIYRNEFETLWNLVTTNEKTAVVTSNPHVLNHLKQKELYKTICDIFFEEPQGKLIHLLQHPNDLKKYYAEKIMKINIEHAVS